MKSILKTLNTKFFGVSGRGGFTIVELLMYMALVTILLTVLTSIFLAALDAQLSSQASSTTLTSGRFILSRLEYDLHRASEVNTPSQLGQTSDGLIISAGGSTLSYGVDNGNLILNTAGSSQVLNDASTTISNLVFTRLGNVGGKPTITISFTITGTESQLPEVRTFETSLGLR